MPSENQDMDFTEIAKLISVTRPVFEALYDPLMLKASAAIPFRALAMVREFEQRKKDPAHESLTDERKKLVADYASALKQASDVGALAEFMAKNAGRLFREQDRPQVDVGLQSIVEFKDVFHDALPISAGRMAALLRCCRITIDRQFEEPEKGSGFLIGPHLVLTNWHVVKSMITDGKEAQDSHRRIKIEFDVLRRKDGTLDQKRIKQYQPIERWLVDMSPAHPNEVGGGGGPENGSWPANPNDLSNYLDFAIIELDGSPGHERGWYDLEKVHWPESGKYLDLFQFPLGKPMVCNSGQFEAPTHFADNAHPPRILHRVNAVRGSSGGLCLDHQSEAVGLHQAGYQFMDGNDQDGNPARVAVKNGAIPLPLIAVAARAKLTPKIQNAPRIMRSTLSGRPILGRGKLQSLVDNAIRGESKVLVVLTSARTTTVTGKLGKTFSVDIIKALLPAGHLLFELPAARLTSDAHKAAQTILESVCRTVPPSFMASASGLTTTDADASVSLAQSVAEEISKVAGDGVIWLVIDDLDRNPVQAESATNTFLSALYQRASANGRIRVVLIGPTSVPPGLAGIATGEDVILDHVAPSDVESWLTPELSAHMPILREFVTTLAAVISSIAKPQIDDPQVGQTKAFADLIATHWLPALRNS